MKKHLPESIRDLKEKRLAFMGMSGVGKTTLSSFLPRETWYHYSIDYRIGTRYLNEDILDFLRKEAMKIPLLATLLRSDSIIIQPNLSFDNLAALSQYLGMVGDLEKGGLPLEVFSDRLQKHREAEINALKDTETFINRAQQIYGYPNFICDTSGSICEIDAPATIAALAQHCLLIYIRATDTMQNQLIKRAQTHPKPLYYQHTFLLAAIHDYCQETHYASWQEIDPMLFARWVFPKLVAHRKTSYQSIADEYGITICASKTQNIRCEDALIELIDETLQTTHSS